MFCGIVIDPTHPLTNYKLLDDIAAELVGNLKIQQQQDLLTRMWKPYMKDLDTMFTDATCYESEMRYPTDQKLLWDSWLHNHFRSGDSRESIPDRIVSVNSLSLIEKLSFNAFSEGTRLPHCITMHRRLFGVDVKKIGGDMSYAGSANRNLNKENGIQISFVNQIIITRCGGSRQEGKRRRSNIYT